MLPLRRALALALSAASVAAVPAVAAMPAASPAPQAPADLPGELPPAGLTPEPALPPAAGWPFPDGFPRTSGTGRLAGGASLWTDFLLDDHGATGLPKRGLSLLAPTAGTYSYPAGPAAGNGADVAAAAVALDDDASYWRLDWRTLVDAAVPTAVWGLDLDGDAATGTATWPGVPGLSSAGLETALVVSSGRASLVDAVTGEARDLTAGLRVDRARRSFVVRVPRAALPVRGRSTVRLVAGLTGEPGVSLAPVPASRGALPGQPAVYNVAFRSHEQEPVGGNDWREARQAAALAGGDVTAFALSVDWAELERGRTTQEVVPTGASNRWYVAGLDTGEGAGPPPADDAIGPVYRGRLQPYGVYVPKRRGDLPVTLLLHSTGSNHNQYGAGNPRLQEQLCEQRGSLCLTPLAYGPSGNYLRSAEVDVWRVWHAAARDFRLDTERTVVSGYSLGGYGAYRLGFTYPDLFAQALVLAGQPDCGPRAARGVGHQPAGPGVCTTDGDTTALVPNARHLPYVIGHGALDQRVPLTNFVQHLSAFDAAGIRYAAELRPAEDHLGYAVKDEFGSLVARLDERPRVTTPGTVDYAFRPALQDPALGVGPDGAWWLSGVQARTRAPGTVARAVVRSGAQPTAPLATTLQRSADATSPPSPALVLVREAVESDVPRRTSTLHVELTGVSRLVVDAPDAGFRRGEAVTVVATTDGPATLRVVGLAPGTVVRADGGPSARADSAGTAELSLG